MVQSYGKTREEPNNLQAFPSHNGPGTAKLMKNSAQNKGSCAAIGITGAQRPAMEGEKKIPAFKIILHFNTYSLRENLYLCKQMEFSKTENFFEN